MKPHSYRSINGYKARLLERIAALDAGTAAELRAMKLDWFRIGNQTAATEDTPSSADIFIYDEIGGSFGVDATELCAAISALEVDEINVRINSPGGSLFDSIAIYNTLVQHPATVNAWVDALAASGASIIAMAGDTVTMMTGSQMMIHDALGMEYGNSRAFREMADFLDRQSDNIVTIYEARAGTETDWRAAMLAETWMFANEAVNMGLADRVYDPPKAAKPVEDPETDDEPDENDEQDDEPLFELMHHKHRLTNRGFKYSGRPKAPDPELVRGAAGPSNSVISKFLERIN